MSGTEYKPWYGPFGKVYRDPGRLGGYIAVYEGAGYGEGWVSRDIFSDVITCVHCGITIPGNIGGQSVATARDHRLVCP